MTPSVTATKWSAIKEHLTSSRQSAQKAVGVLVEAVTAAVPAYRVARSDFIARAMKVSLASLVARCDQDAAPAKPHGELRTLMTKHPGRFENTVGGLAALTRKIRDRNMFGWRLNLPTASGNLILRNAADDSDLRHAIRTELATFGFNPASLFALALEDAAAAEPGTFGDMDLEQEARETQAAVAAVEELKRELHASGLLPEVLARFEIARPGPDPAGQILEAAAARG
jgi:hypothetical protein